MIAFYPPDTELTWPQVEAQIQDFETEAERIWQVSGIKMPEGSAQEIKLSVMDSVLSETAEALNIPVGEVYPLRNRIRWYTSTERAGELECYVSLDNNPPNKTQKQLDNVRK